ncbi:spore photoproduct lyase [Clostridium magnum]|uniref:Spore photoproduct lyase n=1 Tax=Clostridium magnum DSM 2767 TaxID=1121326 RepID=A0A161WUG8_9CLOT|nr:spore photoproduct lyase [Clostridium magnum]KZL90538.1 spore photoproduct lyase [Clostridium magnum DSM 2767]SHI04718.1 spore photoproduct lyase [Clostridium magnum DSM 2767]
MNLFIPDVAYIDPRSTKYPSSKTTMEYLKKFNVPIINSRKVVIEGTTPGENYSKAKRTIYVTINSEKKLKSCKPSADYQFSLSSSCPGSCEYCYLQTTQGEKPFMKVFVNVEDILNVIQEHINSNLPNTTTFECGSITDPVALEHLTGNLKKCIEFFGNSEKGRLRVITKFNNVDSFLDISHNNHTKFRFSVNTPYVISKFEHNTSSFEERVAAAKKIATSGYPIGFIIAPIMIYDNWKSDYKELIHTLKSTLEDFDTEITFELIQHRYTSTAKELILTRFPNTKLDMNDETRQLKWGPYGKFKYVYPKEKSSELKEYISELITTNFKNAVIEYFT